MTDDAQPLTATEKLRQAVAAKKGVKGAPGVAHESGRAAEKVVAQRNQTLAKPAFRKASKRG
ncbi:hypothetical protein [Brevundimonas sp. PAMC22021]|uniref:hypothetical protein n=1 Tax=Brevundimonas sp. PAMC22021 TaxID=2861285 RepID=UPI001C632EA6|nr:hypothetical protein [Brevundimonas sp. PAMC22021]QYF86727.1 hypothetical protein KY493_13065 [Brevundimonas sp. PAMC22021]